MLVLQGESSFTIFFVFLRISFFNNHDIFLNFQIISPYFLATHIPDTNVDKLSAL